MSVLAMTTTQFLFLDQADVAVMLTAKESIILMAVVEDAPFSLGCSDPASRFGTTHPLRAPEHSWRARSTRFGVLTGHVRIVRLMIPYN